MPINRKTTLIIAVILLVFVVAGGFALSSSVQPRIDGQQDPILKLPYGHAEYVGSLTSLPDIRPIAVSSIRLLVPVGDVLYMLDADNRVRWEFSVEPNIFYDVRADAQGRVYLAISDGLFRVLDADGKELWGNFMNGSAQYSQIAPYKEGLLVVVNMWGYRQKGSKSEDHIEYWQNKKAVWRKNFPQEARLEVWGEKIFAVKPTKDGKEIVEIR